MQSFPPDLFNQIKKVSCFQAEIITNSAFGRLTIPIKKHDNLTQQKVTDSNTSQLQLSILEAAIY